MRLIFHGHDERYAVEQSLLAFFPDERPVYDREDGSRAEIRLRQGKKYASAVTVIEYGGKVCRGASRAVLAPELDRYEAERLRQRVVKLSFFKAAQAVTGVTPTWGALTGIRPGKLAERLLLAGNTPRQVDRILDKTYYVSPARRQLAIETAQAGLRAKAELRPEDISLYVGIPFCPTRCAYCSFVSQSVERSLGLIDEYLDVLCREITDAGRMVAETGLRVKSFYMGGGTPTTLSPAQLDRLLGHLNDSFDLSGCAEYCVEAGRPDTIDRDKLAVLLRRGADRISVNPQSLSDRVLAAIGRRHTAADVARAMALALKKGSRIMLEGSAIPSAAAVGQMLDYAAQTLRGKGFTPYYLYRQKYMSGSFENVGWCIPGAEGLYNIYIMEELHSILSLGAGGSTKMVDPVRQRISRVFHPKYPAEYMTRPEKLRENLETFRRFHQELLG